MATVEHDAQEDLLREHLAPGPLPDWITDEQEETGPIEGRPVRFTLDCDRYFPRLMAELGITDADLDQYWCTILSRFATWDASRAVWDANRNVRPNGRRVTQVNKQQKDRDRYAIRYMEYTEVELTPERAVKKGETLQIDGADHVCIEEFGCNRLRSGEIEPGKFRREVEHVRPAGKGVEAGERDARQLYIDKRGIAPA